MRLSKLVITLLVFNSAEEVVSQTRSCHQSKSTEHGADAEDVGRCLSVEKELRSDDIADGLDDGQSMNW